MLRKFLLLLICACPLYAAKPLFKIIPVAGYPNKMTIAGNSSAQVRYTVTNNLKQAQSIVFNPQPGLTQIQGSGYCATTTTLKPNQSCILVLRINGQGLSSIRGGPVMCQALNKTTQPNPFFCSEPNSSDMLNITLLSDVYNLNVNVSGLPDGSSVTVKDGTTTATYNTNGTNTLKSNLNTGTSYIVRVTSASNAVCTVNNGVGTISGADATVNVVCASSSYLVGGVISGLSGSISLLNNLQYSVSQSTNTAYNFAPVANGSSYSVSIVSKPANQTCSITNPTGTVNGANVSNVNVYCASTTYTLGGAITGIPSGESVTLSSGVQNSTFSGNGSFSFPTAYASGTVYNVSVVKQPDNAYCEISNASGTLNANVTNVAVTCHALDYTLGGQIYNLTSPITVTTTIDGVSSTQTIAQNGSLLLSRIFSGATYSVAVSTQATDQTCQIVNNTGTVGPASISNIAIYCGDNLSLQTLGGGISYVWYFFPTPFTLTLNGGIAGVYTIVDPFIFSNYNLPNTLVPGMPYSWNITSPASALSSSIFCIPTNTTGVIRTQVTNAGVWCGNSDEKYTITANVNGLPAGESVVLTLGNSGTTETLSSNGSQTLSQLFIPYLATWQLTVAKQPSSSYCTINPPNGSSTQNNVNVTINCSTASTLVVQETNVSVPINTATAITVYNHGPSVVSDLVVNYPSGWLNFGYNSAECTSLAVGGTCSIYLDSSTPYTPASGITISGTNVGTSNSFNIAFLVNGYYVYNVNGTSPEQEENFAYVVKTLNPTSGQMFTNNMSAPSANLAVSLYDGNDNTWTWVNYASGYANQLAYQQCYAAGDYLPAACEWGPAGATVNSSTCQGSGIYDLVKLGFLSLDPSYSFWTSTQSSSTPTSAYAVNPAGSGTMILNNGSRSNHVICVNTESF